MCPNCGYPHWDIDDAWRASTNRAHNVASLAEQAYPRKCPGCNAHYSGTWRPACASLSSPSDPDDPRWLTTPQEEDEVETLFW